MQLTWNPPCQDSSPVNGYIIEYFDTKATFTSWTNAGFVSTHITTWEQSGLMEGCEYMFRIVGINAKGQSDPLYSERFFIPGKLST